MLDGILEWFDRWNSFRLQKKKRFLKYRLNEWQFNQHAVNCFISFYCSRSLALFFFPSFFYISFKQTKFTYTYANLSSIQFHKVILTHV